VAAVQASVHAKAAPDTCKACHGDAHSMLAKTNPQSAIFAANLPRTCGVCHGDTKQVKAPGAPAQVYAMYIDSIHGFALTKNGLLVAASCSSCHGSHKILSSKDPHSRTARGNIPATCGECHAGSERAYFAGIHGQNLKAGNSAAPVCSDCHTAHQISSRAAFGQMKTTATCGQCHAHAEETYHDTFHSHVSGLGYVEVARCWDCHREHEILPASDPKSAIAPANLIATCGRCHSGANASFVSYYPHADKRDAKAFPVLSYSGMFMNMLLAGTLGFFALHSILWFNRLKFENRQRKHDNVTPKPVKGTL
jgi:5-methylcytosine-specific restriction endonuclease McrA